MPLSYNRNSTVSELKQQGFEALQFQCQNCKRQQAFSLTEFEPNVSYGAIFDHGASCFRCGRTAHWIKPLQRFEGVAEGTPLAPPQLTSTAIDSLAQQLNNQAASNTPETGMLPIFNELQKAINDQAELSARSAAINATGRDWSELRPNERATRIELERRKLYWKVIKQVGLGLAILLGMPTFF